MDVGSRLSRGVRRIAYRIADSLHPPRDKAFRALLRSLRDVVEGRHPRPAPAGSSRSPSARRLIGGPESDAVEPLSEDTNWSSLPASNSGRVVRSVYNTGARPQRYDIELFEQLNAEYAEKRIVPSPPSYHRDARHSAAIGRIKRTHRRVDLRNKTVLEIGCGDGFVVWLLGNDLGCDAYGIDVQQRESWEALEGAKVHYFCADMSLDNPFAGDMFDRVISYTVWEHVLHPSTMLRKTFEVLKPGGLAFIKANLYMGPKASHRYREVYFPWPHLLFSDDVIRDWDVKHGREPRGASWVNRFSWDQYERCISDIGFRFHHLAFDTSEWDEDFYRRFEDTLGRYRRVDLSRDFFTVVLEKPR